MSLKLPDSFPEHGPEMSEVSPCKICNVSFSTKRALASHEKTKTHRTKAGQPYQHHECVLCGRQFSRIYDVSKHQQQGQCPGVQATAAQQTVTFKKRKYSADYSGSSSQRLRTTSPTRIDHLSDKTLDSDANDRNGAGIFSTIDESSRNAGDGGGSTSGPLIQDTADQDGTDVSSMDVVADLDLNGTQGDTYLSPLTIPGACEDAAVLNTARSDSEGSQEVHVFGHLNAIRQIDQGHTPAPVVARIPSESFNSPLWRSLAAPPHTTGDAISTAGGLESLTQALERASMETRPRSSFALSTVTGYSTAASLTRSSIRSYFNPSLKPIRLSWYSHSPQRLSNKSFKSASTVPSEMAGPMLEPVDEELFNSRVSGSRLGRYVPSIFRKDRYPQKGLQVDEKVHQNEREIPQDETEIPQDETEIPKDDERLLRAVQTGHTQDVADILASMTGNIDVNRLDDNGWSPLITATINGHEGIVALLLKQKGLDVSQRDTMGFTASMYAHQLGHLNIKKMFTKFEMEGKPAEEGLVLDDRDDLVYLEKTLHSQRAIDSSSQYLWLACEQGNVDRVAQLITKMNVDPNSLNPRRRTPLSIAASYGHENVVRTLLGYSEVDVTVRDVTGATALTWAAARGHLTILELLLSSEPLSPRNKETRWAALELAEEKGHNLIVSALIMNMHLHPVPDLSIRSVA